MEYIDIFFLYLIQEIDKTKFDPFVHHLQIYITSCIMNFIIFSTLIMD